MKTVYAYKNTLHKRIASRNRIPQLFLIGLFSLLAGTSFQLTMAPANAAFCNVASGNALLTSPCGPAFILGTQYNNGTLTNLTEVNTNATAIFVQFDNSFTKYSLVNGSITQALPSISSFGSYGVHFQTTGGSATADLTNYGRIESTGAGSFAVFNDQGVSITNLTNASSGRIVTSSPGESAVVNWGTINSLSNQGLISSGNNNAIYNNTGAAINSIINTGSISGVAGIANYQGNIFLIENLGSIIATTSNAISNSGGNIGTINNSGTISSSGADAINVSSGSSTVINQNAGSITGGINLAAANSVINVSGGTITGDIDLSGSQANIINMYAGTIIGNINFNGALANELNIRTGEPLISGDITNTVANKLTMNVDGAFLTLGNIGTAAAPINSLNINANGDFIQTAGYNVYATTTNINYNGIYMPLANNLTLNSNVNVNEGGLFAVLDSGWTANINGALTMATGSAAFIPIGLASASDYGKIVSNQPLNIADGSFIVAVLDPTQKPALGTVLNGVIRGNGAPTQAGQMIVLNSSSRYQFQAQWDGNEVDLVLPNRRTSSYSAVFGSGCSGNSVSSSSVLGSFSGYSPGCGGTNGTGGVYDGALTQQTLQSISAIQGPTLGLLHQRYAMLNAVMEYDCNKFDKHNFCLSFQARATGFGAQSTGAGVFNIAYRPSDQMRVGAYLDYQVTSGNPVLNTIYGSGTYYSGSAVSGYDNPTFGGYVGFSQSGYSGRILNTGAQASISGGYNPGKVSVTRALTMDQYDASFVDSQPGSGTASLNSYFYRGMVGYGLGLTEQVTLMPYGGMRITDVTRGGYMEGYNAVVQQPLVFSSYGEHLFTGFGGLMLNGQMTSQLGVLFGLGAEADIKRSASNFEGYSPIAIERMTVFGYSHGSSYNGIRPTGNAGVYYNVAPNQRIMLNGYAGQQAWSSRTYTSGLLGYQIAF